MSQVITGTNIYTFTITSDGYEISQKNSKSKFIQKIPLDGIDADEWKKEDVRIAAAEEKTLKLNTALLNSARLTAKQRIRDLFERSTYLPMHDEETNTDWDATLSSPVELVVSQLLLQDAGLPIVLNDAYNKPHQFDYPASKKNVAVSILPIISRIGMSIVPKIQKKNLLYSRLLEMHNIDEILRYNPFEEFGLSEEEAESITALKAYF